MAKKENLVDETYVVDTPTPSRLRSWLGTRSAKITAVSVGAALAIGVAFTGGVVAAKTILPNHDGPGFAEGFDRDGDGPHKFDGQRPPKPGHNSVSTPTTTTP